MRFAHRACIFIALITVFPLCVNGQVTYHFIAVSNDEAPGADAVFLRFSNPVINAFGNVAFQAHLSGSTSDVVPHGTWVSSNVSLRPLAIAGHEAAGVDGARFKTPGWPLILTPNDESLFYGNLVNENGIAFENDYGIWVGPPEDLHLLARKSDPAPGLPTDVNYSLFFANPHSSGQIGFSASLQGTGVDTSNDSAAWVGNLSGSGSLHLIARGGDVAPDLPAGSRFVSIGTPSVNAVGHVAMLSTATVGGDVTQRIGLWAGAPSDLHLVAIGNSPAAGVPGWDFDFFSSMRLNSAGQVAFKGFLESDSDEQRLNGIWAGAAVATGIEPVAIEGQPAPGFESGVVFRGSAPGDVVSYSAFGNPVLGGDGHVAFAATVFGIGVDFNHNDGVWVSDPMSAPGGNLTLVAREGDRPPGTPEGTRFAGIFNGDDLISAFEHPSLNSGGQVAFEALTTGPLGEFGRGIWATDHQAICGSSHIQAPKLTLPQEMFAKSHS
jgi:hypothetical protein